MAAGGSSGPPDNGTRISGRGCGEQAETRGPDPGLRRLGVGAGQAAFPGGAQRADGFLLAGMCVILNSSRFFLMDFLSLKKYFCV